MKRMQKRTVIGFLVFGLVALLGWVNPGNAYEGGEVTNGGTITGKVWHETLGEQVKPVAIKEKGQVQVDFELK